MDPQPHTHDDLDRLADHYQRLVRRSNRGHYTAAERLTNAHRWLGIGAAVSTAVVGTSIFATLNEAPETVWRIAAGGVSVLAAVLVTLQTTLQLDDRAAAHRHAGAAYGRLRRQFQLHEANPETPTTPAERFAALRRLVDEMDQLGESSPLIPPAADRAVARRDAAGGSTAGT